MQIVLWMRDVAALEADNNDHKEKAKAFKVNFVLVHVVIWRLDHHAKMGASLLSIGS
jgi:hypothetical protein